MARVRPHYKQSWPPMVHAVALWLTSTAFKDPEKSIIGASKLLEILLVFLIMLVFYYDMFVL